MEDITRIQTLMAEINASLPEEEVNKLFHSETPNLPQINIHMSTEKTNSPEYAAVAATLGLQANYEAKDVMARLNVLVSVEARLKETENPLPMPRRSLPERMPLLRIYKRTFPPPLLP